MKRKSPIKPVFVRAEKRRLQFSLVYEIHYLLIRSVIMVFLVFSATALSAQSENKFSLGGNFGFFTGYETTPNFGIDVQFEASVKNELKATASFGANGFVIPHSDAGGVYLPLLVGLKYQFSDPGFYLHVQMGSGGFTYFSHHYPGVFGTSNFAYSLSPGYIINDHLDISVRYLRFNTNSTGTINLRVAWIF